MTSGRHGDQSTEPINTSCYPEGLPKALTQDPARDIEHPAETLAVAIPSNGVNLNAVLYTARGLGPHPTVLLLHGLPGNEQNLDLAQSIRRAGWNVLTLHYRGSWGSPGSFSFSNCLEDGAAAVAWLRELSANRLLRIDAAKILVVGHSMGGFVAAQLVAASPTLIGAGLISGVALGPVFGAPHQSHAAAAVDENVGTSQGLHILSGTSPSLLAKEAAEKAEQWGLGPLGPKLSDRPLLLVTSDDGFASGSNALARAVERCESAKLHQAHFPTDHSYSDHRLALQIVVLSWLEGIQPAPAQ